MDKEWLFCSSLLIFVDSSPTRQVSEFCTNRVSIITYTKLQKKKNQNLTHAFKIIIMAKKILDKYYYSLNKEITIA